MAATDKPAVTKGGILDLDSQFLFYHSYHTNFVNQVIHIVCVWPILWTALCMMHHAPAFMATPEFFWDWVVINWALLSTVLYVAFYLALEFKNRESLSGLGILAAMAAVFCYYSAGVLKGVGELEVPGIEGLVPVWKLAAVVHVAGWVAQFVGHGVFEGRAPALLDNLVQAFFMAPIFVIMEAYFMIGWKPWYRHELEERTKAALAAKDSKDTKEKKDT